MTSLAKLGASVGRAAVFGYGASAGRSAWKKTEKYSGSLFLVAVALAVCLAAVVLPFWGARETVRGHQRTPLASLFLTVLVPIGAILLGAGATVIVDLLIQGLQGIKSETAEPRILVIAGIVGVAALLGYLSGLNQRSGRLRAFAVIKLNEGFLRARGIREVSEPNASHIDRWGNLLRLLDHDDTQMTFLAVGKRSKRAYIEMAADGRMLAYSGVVVQGSHWDGTDLLETQPGLSEAIPPAIPSSVAADRQIQPSPIEYPDREAQNDAFLASLKPAAVTVTPNSIRAPAAPLHWALFWPLSLVGSVFSGFLALCVWVTASPLAIRSHPLSIFVVLVPAAITIVVLYRRRKNRWAIRAAALSQ